MSMNKFNFSPKAGIFATLLLAFAFLCIPASAQSGPDCPLIIKNISGDVSNYKVGNFDGTTLSISISESTAGFWGTLQVTSSINTNISTIVVPVGTQNPIYITATKIDPSLPANFSLLATDTLKHSITIDVFVNCQTPVQGCTRTQGYWKNHASAWSVSSLTLGSVSYSKNELLSIFGIPVRGNGLVSLAHQLIAAKLNVAAGVSVPGGVETTITAADALIGSRIVPPVGNSFVKTSLTSTMTSVLDSYNNGRFPNGPQHCDGFVETIETFQSKGMK